MTKQNFGYSEREQSCRGGAHLKTSSVKWTQQQAHILCLLDQMEGEGEDGERRLHTLARSHHQVARNWVRLTHRSIGALVEVGGMQSEDVP